MAEVKPEVETIAKIKVVGVGGSGGSAVNRMIRSKIRGVDFLAINTDVQALHNSQANTKLHIGKLTTRGLGAGMDPAAGEKSAEESQNEIRDLLKDADMVFVTCGLGGGTGTGAAPIVAEMAKNAGALTIAVVTKPFSFEGSQRRAIAERGYNNLKSKVDAIITIPNDRLLQIIDKKTSLLEAFKICDDVLQQGVQGIAELITMHGLINVDFADVKAVMADAGSALMGIGYGSGDDRAVKAAREAIASPLLDLSIEGAKGVLFTVVGGPGLGMHEVSEAANVITESVDSSAKIIWGAVIDPDMKDDVKVTVIATGFTDRDSKSSMVEMIAKSEPAYTPSEFVGNQIKYDEREREYEEKNPLRRVMSNPVRKMMAPKVQQTKEEIELEVPTIFRNAKLQKPNESNEEEELDIPAFIRKKMK